MKKLISKLGIEWEDNIIWMRVGDLINWIKNPRKLTNYQVDQIKKSIERFGVVEPLIVNRDNVIIGGHARREIIGMLVGYDPDFKVPVRKPVKQIKEKDLAELNIRLNKNTGGWDYDIMANNFEMEDLTNWGFSEDELTGLDFDDFQAGEDEESNEDEDTQDEHRSPKMITCPKCGHVFRQDDE